jgi:hypothetical protein
MSYAMVKKTDEHLAVVLPLHLHGMRRATLRYVVDVE